uniref:Titin-like n=1 Tax=Drosophila rhopaloa TaxID=1041015 RepID=A0A6P4F9E2_DRORH
MAENMYNPQPNSSVINNYQQDLQEFSYGDARYQRERDPRLRAWNGNRRATPTRRPWIPYPRNTPHHQRVFSMPTPNPSQYSPPNSLAYTPTNPPASSLPYTPPHSTSDSSAYCPAPLKPVHFGTTPGYYYHGCWYNSELPRAMPTDPQQVAQQPAMYMMTQQQPPLQPVARDPNGYIVTQQPSQPVPRAPQQPEIYLINEQQPHLVAGDPNGYMVTQQPPQPMARAPQQQEIYLMNEQQSQPRDGFMVNQQPPQPVVRAFKQPEIYVTIQHKPQGYPHDYMVNQQSPQPVATASKQPEIYVTIQHKPQVDPHGYIVTQQTPQPVARACQQPELYSTIEQQPRRDARDPIGYMVTQQPPQPVARAPQQPEYLMTEQPPQPVIYLMTNKPQVQAPPAPSEIRPEVQLPPVSEILLAPSVSVTTTGDKLIIDFKQQYSYRSVPENRDPVGDRVIRSQFPCHQSRLNHCLGHHKNETENVETSDHSSIAMTGLPAPEPIQPEMVQQPANMIQDPNLSLNTEELETGPTEVGNQSGNLTVTQVEVGQMQVMQEEHSDTTAPHLSLMHQERPTILNLSDQNATFEMEHQVDTVHQDLNQEATLEISESAMVIMKEPLNNSAPLPDQMMEPSITAAIPGSIEQAHINCSVSEQNAQLHITHSLPESIPPLEVTAVLSDPTKAQVIAAVPEAIEKSQISDLKSEQVPKTLVPQISQSNITEPLAEKIPQPIKLSTAALLDPQQQAQIIAPTPEPIEKGHTLASKSQKIPKAHALQISQLIINEHVAEKIPQPTIPASSLEPIKQANITTNLSKNIQKSVQMPKAYSTPSPKKNEPVVHVPQWPPLGSRLRTKVTPKQGPVPPGNSFQKQESTDHLLKYMHHSHENRMSQPTMVPKIPPTDAKRNVLQQKNDVNSEKQGIKEKSQKPNIAKTELQSPKSSQSNPEAFSSTQQDKQPLISLANNSSKSSPLGKKKVTAPQSHLPLNSQHKYKEPGTDAMLRVSNMFELLDEPEVNIKYNLQEDGLNENVDLQRATKSKKMKRRLKKEDTDRKNLLKAKKKAAKEMADKEREAKENKAKENKAKENKAKENKAQENKAKENKAEENKAKEREAKDLNSSIPKSDKRNPKDQQPKASKLENIKPEDLQPKVQKADELKLENPKPKDQKVAPDQKPEEPKPSSSKQPPSKETLKKYSKITSQGELIKNTGTHLVLHENVGRKLVPEPAGPPSPPSPPQPRPGAPPPNPQPAPAANPELMEPRRKTPSPRSNELQSLPNSKCSKFISAVREAGAVQNRTNSNKRELFENRKAAKNTHTPILYLRPNIPAANDQAQNQVKQADTAKELLQTAKSNLNRESPVLRLRNPSPVEGPSEPDVGSQDQVLTEKSEKSEESDKLVKSDQSDKLEKSEKSDKLEKSDNSDKVKDNNTPFIFNPTATYCIGSSLGGRLQDVANPIPIVFKLPDFESNESKLWQSNNGFREMFSAQVNTCPPTGEGAQINTPLESTPPFTGEGAQVNTPLPSGGAKLKSVSEAKRRRALKRDFWRKGPPCIERFIPYLRLQASLAPTRAVQSNKFNPPNKIHEK